MKICDMKWADIKVGMLVRDTEEGNTGDQGVVSWIDKTNPVGIITWIDGFTSYFTRFGRYEITDEEGLV